MTPPSHAPLDTTPAGLTRLYCRMVLTAVASVLVLQVLLRLVLGSGVALTPHTIALYGAILVTGWFGHEMARDPSQPTREPKGLLLGVQGLLLVLLCVETGGLASAYYLLVVVTCLFGALVMRSQKAFILTTLLGMIYCAAGWLYPEEGGVLRGGLRGVQEAIARPRQIKAEEIAALVVHVGFLYVGTWIAIRLASGFRERMTRLETNATRDPLTGLPNRRAFTGKLQLEIERAMQWDWPIAMLVIDLDHFKSVNDRFGHPVGDRVLAQAAGLLREAAGPVDHLARVGGEEFAVAAVGADTRHGGDLADRIVRSFRTYEWESIQPGLGVTCSVGVALLQPGREGRTTVDLGELMDLADRALLQVKQNGRNGYLIAGDLGPGGIVASAPVPAGSRGGHAPAPPHPPQGRPPTILRG